MANNMLSKIHSFDNHRVLIPEISDANPRPKICVICVASYNSGTFFGQWIDATQDVEVIYREINIMLSKSPVAGAFEWAIYAYGGFDSLMLDKYEDLESIHQKAMFIAVYGGWSTGLIKYYKDDLDMAEEAIVNHYEGKFSDKINFAEIHFDRECKMKIPEHMRRYINYELFTNDIFKSDYYAITSDVETHIFSVMRSTSY